MRIPTASTARPAPPTALAGIGRIADGLGTLPGRMATGAALGAGQDALLNGGNVNGLDILTGAIGGAAAPGRRKELGLTQAETAGRCDLDQAKISRIEGSDAVPTLTLPYKLSKGLEATLRVDIDFDDEEPKITPTPTSTPPPDNPDHPALDPPEPTDTTPSQLRSLLDPQAPVSG